MPVQPFDGVVAHIELTQAGQGRMRQTRKLRQLVMAHIQPDHVTNPRDRKRRQTTVATTDVQAVGKVTLRAGDDGERQQPAQQDNSKATEHGDVTVRLQDGPAEREHGDVTATQDCRNRAR